MSQSGWVVESRSVALPAMAWVMAVKPPRARIFHGPLTRSFGDNGVFEGTWVGDDSIDGLVGSTTTFGSGAVVNGGALYLIPPSHHLEAIYLHRAGAVIYASNSLVGLLAAAGLKLERGVDYPELFSHAGDGDFRFSVPTDRGPVEVLLYESSVIKPDGDIRDSPKPRELPFNGFDDYRSRLAAAIAGVARNAPAFEVVPTISSGYDSASMAVLAREVGAQRAVTISQGKPVRATKRTSDTGEPVARALGLELKSFDRLEYLSRGDLPEAEFLASGMSGEDVVFAGMAEDIRETILVTGFFGDGMWWSHRPHRPLFWRLEQAGLSFTEFRLRTGFIHVPLPWFGASQMDNVMEITRSDAMRPWVLGIDNDRPIPRRILEEAGVARGTFADAKRATSAPLQTQGPVGMSAASRASLEAYAAAHGERVVFVRRTFPRWRRFLYTRSRRLKLARLAEMLERPRRRVVRHQPEFGNLILRWAVDTIRPRYREAERIDIE